VEFSPNRDSLQRKVKKLKANLVYPKSAVGSTEKDGGFKHELYLICV
jgi:hypothetical protein